MKLSEDSNACGFSGIADVASGSSTYEKRKL